MKRIVLAVLFGLSLTPNSGASVKIITINDDPTSALTTKAVPVVLDEQGLSEAAIIVKDLRETLLPMMPAAGLAAPQIGVKKRVVIFSWDRTVENLQAAINPTYVPQGDQTITSWEACLSSAPKEGPCQATHMDRYLKILATYYDESGKKVESIMEGFAAKVFQHECDHLDGMVNINQQRAEVKEFPTFDEFATFMKGVKTKDSESYTSPRPHE